MIAHYHLNLSCVQAVSPDFVPSSVLVSPDNVAIVEHGSQGMLAHRYWAFFTLNGTIVVCFILNIQVYCCVLVLN